MEDGNDQGLQRRTFLKRMARVAGTAPLAPGILAAVTETAEQGQGVHQ